MFEDQYNDEMEAEVKRLEAKNRASGSPLTVVAKIVAKKDSIALVKAELLKLIAPTREENGCIEYRLHQDTEDPAVFIFFETWESLASLEMHMNTHHFKHYVSAVESLIAEKVVHKMAGIE